MNTDDLRRALARDSADFTPELTERVIDALVGGSATNGLPDLDFLPAALQVSVLTMLYAEFLEQTAAAGRLGAACV